MRCGSNMIRSCAACGLTAAALLTSGGTAQAQRPGGIGGQAGGGGAPALPGGNGLAGNPSAAFAGSGGGSLGGGPGFSGAGAMPGAGPLTGTAFGGTGMAGGASAMAPFASTYGGTLSGGSLGAAPGGALGTSGALGASGANGGVSTRARSEVNAYGALGILAAARTATPGPPAGAARGSAVSLSALSPATEAEFRDLASRSGGISPATRDGVRFGMDGASVVLRGSAADEAEARALESLIRYAPGVREVRNEMTWQAP